MLQERCGRARHGRYIKPDLKEQNQRSVRPEEIRTPCTSDSSLSRASYSHRYRLGHTVPVFLRTCAKPLKQTGDPADNRQEWKDDRAV